MSASKPDVSRVGPAGAVGLFSFAAALFFGAAAVAAADDFAAVFDDDEWEEAEPYVWDPLRGFNRVVFRFNEGLYTVALRPVADFYTTVTPEPVRDGIGNFTHNLRFPIRLVSNVLQGKLDNAARETGRFLVNTTLGFGGVLPAADEFSGLAVRDAEDLGQTLGAWGVPNGPYIVVPVLGPTTLRDGVGSVGDWFLHPLAIMWWSDSYPASFLEERAVHYVYYGVEALDNLPETLEVYDAFTADAIDPYAAVRHGYIEYRKERIRR